MAQINLTLMFGHPLGLAPPVQASAPIAPNGGMYWTIAQPSQAAPGGVTPPVIS